MYISLNDLQQYIFGQRAVIRNLSKHDIAAKIKEKFSCLLDNNESHKIYNLLTVLNAKNLQAILFSPDFQMQHEEIVFPDDQQITEKFIDLNNHYQYFTDSDSAKFIEFFKIFKIVSDYLEFNNHDGTAALHAYKAMVLFGFGNPGNSFANIEKYLKCHGLLKENKPVHDAFIYEIPVCDETVQLPLWQSWIQKHGKAAVKLFSMSNDIRSHLGREPQSFAEAEEVSNQLSYKRYEEFPELGRLCRAHQISEDNFNECLEIEKLRKTRDNLPDVMIDGSLHGFPGYFLLKLPIADPRAYILGKLTHCCQSIGDHSEQCVIDGITRENNGFYVLLKGAAKSAPLNETGQINYKEFKIIGQGYAWISLMNNLVFDSWENLHTETDNPVIFSLLRAFAEECFENHNIMKISIGTGGKTPGLFDNIVLAEIMKEGAQYYDSRQQSLVGLNTRAQNQIKAQFFSYGLENKLLDEDHIDELRKIIFCDSLCLPSDLMDRVQNDHGIYYFCNAYRSYPEYTTYEFFLLYEFGLLNESSVRFLLNRCKGADRFEIVPQVINFLIELKNSFPEIDLDVLDDYIKIFKPSFQNLKGCITKKMLDIFQLCKPVLDKSLLNTLRCRGDLPFCDIGGYRWRWQTLNKAIKLLADTSEFDSENLRKLYRFTDTIIELDEHNILNQSTVCSLLYYHKNYYSMKPMTEVAETYFIRAVQDNHLPTVEFFLNHEKKWVCEKVILQSVSEAIHNKAWKMVEILINHRGIKLSTYTQELIVGTLVEDTNLECFLSIYGSCPHLFIYDDKVRTPLLPYFSRFIPYKQNIQQMKLCLELTKEIRDISDWELCASNNESDLHKHTLSLTDKYIEMNHKIKSVSDRYLLSYLQNELNRIKKTVLRENTPETFQVLRALEAFLAAGQEPHKILYFQLTEMFAAYRFKWARNQEGNLRFREAFQEWHDDAQKCLTKERAILLVPLEKAFNQLLAADLARITDKPVHAGFFQPAQPQSSVNTEKNCII